MAGFAKLTPAFTALIPIQPFLQAGVLSSGPALIPTAFEVGQGGITSEADYPIALDATWVHGTDYIKGDPDGEHSRLDVDSLAKDKKTGALVRFRYTGVLNTGGPTGKVLRGDGDAATTEFGYIFTHAKFETGHPDLRALENKVYVGSGRLVLEAGKPLVVEYKISEVSG